MRKLLLVLILLLVMVMVSSAQADSTPSVLHELWITDITSAYNFGTEPNRCDFPLADLPQDSFTINIHASITLGDNDVRRMFWQDRLADWAVVEGQILDGSGQQIGGVDFIECPYETHTRTWTATLYPGIAPVSRPWTLVLTDGGNELDRITFDPSEWLASCADLPYVTPESDSGPSSITGDGLLVSVFDGHDGNGGPSLDVYGINEEGAGYYLFSITEELLAPYVENPPQQNTEILSVDNVALYMLDTGEYQLNAGPDAEGKVHVVVFDGLPPTNVYSYDFNVYDILAGE